MRTAFALWLGRVCTGEYTGRLAGCPPGRLSHGGMGACACLAGVGVEDPVLGDVHLSKNNWLTLSLNERSSVEAGKVGEVAQVLWLSGGPGWRKGKGGEHCLEFDQVLLEDATNLGQGPQEEWVLGLPDTALAYRGQLLPRDSRDRTRGPRR